MRTEAKCLWTRIHKSTPTSFLIKKKRKITVAVHWKSVVYSTPVSSQALAFF